MGETQGLQVTCLRQPPQRSLLIAVHCFSTPVTRFYTSDTLHCYMALSPTARTDWLVDCATVIELLQEALLQ